MKVHLKKSVREQLDSAIEEAAKEAYEIDFFELSEAEYLSLYRELMKNDVSLAVLLEDYGYRRIPIKYLKAGKPIK